MRSFVAGVFSCSVAVPVLVANAEDSSPPLTAGKLYNGPTSYGFKFKYPASWKANKKIGNKHLYDLEVKPSKGGGSMSITIDKTPSNSMPEFGALDAIAEKLRAQLQASRKGDVVKVVSSREEQTRDKKMTYYTIELEDSKSKRLSKITITAQQLFVMQIEMPKSDEDVLGTMAQQALASFQVLHCRPSCVPMDTDVSCHGAVLLCCASSWTRAKNSFEHCGIVALLLVYQVYTVALSTCRSLFAPRVLVQPNYCTHFRSFAY